VSSFAPVGSLTVVQAVALAGRPVTRDFGTSRTLVAVVDPGCKSCETGGRLAERSHGCARALRGLGGEDAAADGAERHLPIRLLAADRYAG
jgi:hypothetical protein